MKRQLSKTDSLRNLNDFYFKDSKLISEKTTTELADKKIDDHIDVPNVFINQEYDVSPSFLKSPEKYLDESQFYNKNDQTLD